MIYSLETYRLRWGRTAAFAEAFSTHYRPLVEELGARLVGAWQPTSFSHGWPGALLLWEFDDAEHLQDFGLDLHRGALPPITAWEQRTEGLVVEAEGRVLHPTRSSPTHADLTAREVDLDVVVYEIIQTQPDRGVQYGEHIEDVWLPVADALGRIWVGTYHTAWKNQEAISIWALKDPRRPMPGDVAADDGSVASGLRRWSRSAGSVRVGYDDGVFVTLGGLPD